MIMCGHSRRFYKWESRQGGRGGQCELGKVKVWWWVVEAVSKGCSTMMVRVVET